MKVKVVLLQTIPNLGSVGDVASVARGFFMNYLLPNRKASFLDKNSSVNIESIVIEQKKREDLAKEIANDIKNQISDFIIKFSTQATDDGKIFGSIGLENIRKKINDQISNLGFEYEIENGNVFLSNNVTKIKTIGEYVVKVIFFPGISCELSIVVDRV